MTGQQFSRRRFLRRGAYAALGTAFVGTAIHETYDYRKRVTPQFEALSGKHRYLDDLRRTVGEVVAPHVNSPGATQGSAVLLDLDGVVAMTRHQIEAAGSDAFIRFFPSGLKKIQTPLSLEWVSSSMDLAFGRIDRDVIFKEDLRCVAWPQDDRNETHRSQLVVIGFPGHGSIPDRIDARETRVSSYLDQATVNGRAAACSILIAPIGHQPGMSGGAAFAGSEFNGIYSGDLVSGGATDEGHAIVTGSAIRRAYIALYPETAAKMELKALPLDPKRPSCMTGAADFVRFKPG